MTTPCLEFCQRPVRTSSWQHCGRDFVLTCQLSLTGSTMQPCSSSCKHLTVLEDLSSPGLHRTTLTESVVLYGVPKDLVLGPILFQLSTADLLLLMQ